ncbi:uncharacterized protein C8R40DRAFT_1165909 [Lentinula edodes]|uniref:uncharacterized protein n=1 Tax=Lentinula edodes TaxID=5353 RepID=UPI001E8D912D|nr:uncharacterized protein C8R40DRAFT_1165909 [Lentinula edodes]KAH7879659.1 hypothetical protein C8R40DRAFT_1165909 [Lentinula edodes]
MSQTTFKHPLPLETSEAILDLLPLPDLLSFGKTCKQTRMDVRKYKERSSVGLLVSGSTVLEFFNREIYNGDLDTFCNIQHCKIAGDWLISHGYSYRPKEGQAIDFDSSFSETYNKETASETPEDADTDEYKFNTVVNIWNFMRSSSKIQLIATGGAPLESIFSFHSTNQSSACVMNVFTHRAAYCLFSKLTLEEKTTMLIDIQAPLNAREMYPIQKYKNRGFNVIHYPDFRLVCDPSSSLSALVPRYVGDRHCCRVPFHQCSTTTSDIDFLEVNSWVMGYTTRFNTIKVSVLSISGIAVDCVFAPQNLAQIRTQLAAIRDLIRIGAVRSELAIMLIQTIIRDSHQRPITESSFWIQFRKIFNCVNNSGMSVHPATSQQLIELFMVVRSNYTDVTVDDPYVIHDENDVAKLRLIINIGPAKTRVNRVTLTTWARAFAAHDILIMLYQKM